MSPEISLEIQPDEEIEIVHYKRNRILEATFSIAQFSLEHLPLAPETKLGIAHTLYKAETTVANSRTASYRSPALSFLLDNEDPARNTNLSHGIDYWGREIPEVVVYSSNNSAEE